MRKIAYALIGCGMLLVHSLSLAAASGYCDSNSRNTYYFWQNSITIGETVVSSGNNSGYNFTADTGITLQPGDNVIQLNPAYRFYNYTVYWRGWLDLNGDGQFTTDEQLFQTTSRGPVSVTASLPETFEVESSTLRIAMKYGSYPSACEVYYYGETEDLGVDLQQPEPVGVALEDTYHLKLDSDFKLHRTGAIGDDVSWVVEKNGAVVLNRGAASELEYRYFSNTQGADFRVWLEQWVAGSYQRVSNIVEYTPGTTDLFELQLSEGYQINRSGVLGETGTLTWVIEMDGNIVLERLATNELNYVYYRNWAGTHFRVWLKQVVDGQYQVVSNTVEYQPNQTEFNLTLDQKYKLTRDGQPGDQVRWIVEQNGMIIVDRDASVEMEYTFMESQPGARYRLWLQMNIGGQDQIVSNVLSYDEPTSYPYELGLEPNYKLTRSGNLGESLSWVIIKDDDVVLQRSANNELSYTYSSNTAGSYFQVYLQQSQGGYAQRVSNIVRYEVKNFGYTVSVDQNYVLSRNGMLGEPLTWVIEENGQQVAQQDASQALSFTYPGNTPGAAYRVWLAMVVDGTLRPVSNATYYQVPEEKPPLPSFTLTLGADYVITRDGSLGDPVRWMVEENGVVIASKYGADSFDFTYLDHQPRGEYRIWLVDDASGEMISNAVMYEFVASITYTLTLGEDYAIERSGEPTERLEWVVSENGMEIWRADASYQMTFRFPYHTFNSVYKVWLVDVTSGESVSNVVSYSYVLPGSQFSISSNGNYSLERTGIIGEPLSWIVEENGVIVGDYSARDSLNFSYQNNTPGSTYRIWLIWEGDDAFSASSNIVSYEVADSTYEYSITLNADGTVTRSGVVGEELELLFYRDGQLWAAMDASQELVLSPSFLSSGTYQAYLVPWYGEETDQVSNSLDITVP